MKKKENIPTNYYQRRPASDNIHKAMDWTVVIGVESTDGCRVLFSQFFPILLSFLTRASVSADDD